MKMNKTIIRFLIVVMVAIMGMGVILPSLAVTSGSKTLSLSHFRDINGEPKFGYQIQTSAPDIHDRHTIFQIVGEDRNSSKKSAYYCLSACFGNSWTNYMNPNNTSASTNNQADYTGYYDLDSEMEELSNSSRTQYSCIAGTYREQILWILNNLYIPTTEADNTAQKNNFLANAGIVYANMTDSRKAYKYVPTAEYDYRDHLNASQVAVGGWEYLDNEKKYVTIDITDDIIEISQQLALWYYTNYKENNPDNDGSFNFKDKKVDLYRGINGTDTSYSQWPTFDAYKTVGYGNMTYDVGRWIEDQVTILTEYLIDAAEKNKSSVSETGTPVKLEQTTAGLNTKTVNNTDYYVVGPINISEIRTILYDFDNTIKINNDLTTGAYISDAEGNRNSEQSLKSYVGRDLYIAVPKSKISGENITIEFKGSYNTNTKTLWVNEAVGEQPIVEVTPVKKDFILTIGANVPQPKKEFDLALRKVITAINGKSTSASIKNEANLDAIRTVNVDDSKLANNTKTTAEYKHRKDPVIVKKGDIVTYSITIYNEGEMDGYAKTIVDKLPQGLALSGFTANRTTRGTCKAGDINYSYEYNPNNNTIIFTRSDSDNDKTIDAYNGQGNLDSETIQIDCEVVQEPSTTTNTYLTNIAYISKAHNTETNEDVTQDRDSSTDRNPTPEQNIKADKYPKDAYHGSSNKDVYNDTNNDRDYFPGMEDDDDFEIVVVKPAEFDLALQKYIANIIKPDGTMTPGRNAPTINTNQLKPNGIETTANYTFEPDKKEIKVKSGDYVLYTITVYNEGEVDGYVKKITDNIPEGLEFVCLPGGSAQDGKTIMVFDSKGNGKQIEVPSSIYQAIDRYNSYWDIDKNGNNLYKDTYNGKETISISCDVESADLKNSSGFLKAYDNSKDNNYDGAGLDRISVQVLLKVSDDKELVKKLIENKDKIRNEAAITKATLDEQGNIIQDRDFIDRDSQTNQWPGKDGDKNYQDDEDYDHIVLERVDLALTKFIIAFSEKYPFKDGDYLTDDGTNINAGSSSNPYTRQTNVNTNPLKDGENDAIYTQVKTSLSVPSESYVLYNIRVYNEGDVDVYAGEVKDYLPNYLDFVEGEANDRYGWKVASDGKTVTTDYLSKAKNADKILKAFDKDNDNGKGSKLDYEDLPILCRVNTNAPDKTRLVNSSEITKYEDKDGKEIETDIDSQPDNLPEDKKNKEGKPEGRYDQDDEDYEVIEIKKPIVDLALTKFLTAVSEDDKIENGEYLTPNGNVGSKENPYDRATKVETAPLKEGKDDAKYTMVKDSYPVPAESYVLYNIRVYNEGPTNVYAGEVKDYLPNYLDFVEGEFNTAYGWKVSSDGKTVTTNYLSKENGTDKILKAFDKDNDDNYGSGLDYKDLPILCKVNTKAPDKAKLVNSSEITKYEDKNGNKINTDRDSQPDNLPEDKKNKEGKPEGRYDQDDEDYEVIEIKKPIVDLALTKFLTAVSEDDKIENGEYLTPNGNVGSKENPYDRATKVETAPLKEGKDDAKYTMVKDSYPVPAESYVLYNIRVYNEGPTNVYAGEVKDYLPNYLDFVEGEFNTAYGWKVSSDGKTVTTNYLSKENGTDKILKAFDKDNDDNYGSGLDYKDLPILCKVNTKAPDKAKLVNSSEITKYEDKNGNEINTDRDSQPDNLPEDKKNKEGKPEGRYDQDDEDYEVIEIEKPIVDLALIKFIAAVSSDTEISDGEYLTPNGNKGSKDNQYDRIKDIITDKLKKDKNWHDVDYQLNKDPLPVPAESYVLYNIRVYNEGQADVYAGEVTDHLPEYLDYVDCDFNKNTYGWKVAEDGKTISTTYLSHDVNPDKILKAFDRVNDDEHGSGLDYQDLQVLCRVNDKAPTNTNIVNIAEITRYENKDGDPIPDDDIDSKPNNVNEKNEDDDDYEVVLIKTFDLSLLKYVSEVYVTEDGKTTTTKTGNTGDNSKDIIPKVEINKKKLNSTVVKFGYTIKITNEGDIEGYAKEITDYVPEGLKFYAEDNNGWKDEGNNVISTRLLENTLLKPGESAEVKVVFRWINGSNNMGLKTNVAEISEDYNKEGIPDRDSTPDNRKDGEDDIDDAKVILSIKTGLVYNFVMYATVGLIILIVLGSGITVIKKYVL